MRFRLLLRIEPQVMGREIPINYQYPLHSAIYKILSKSDSEFASWLHDNGYHSDSKRFKLFTFSFLNIPLYKLRKERERLLIKSDIVTFDIGFLSEKCTQQFIQGLFLDRTLIIADNISGAQFKVAEIQMLKPLAYNPDIVFETLSPICISRKNEKSKMDYLSPEDERYEQGILIGLLTRYKAFYGEDFKGEAYCKLHLLNTPKSYLIRIKSGTTAQTHVRGFQYHFRIELPQALMHIAYESGLGEKGSMGFGMIGVIG